MNDEKDNLPSDVEDGGLKPRTPKDGEPSTPPLEDGKVQEDPSEQPS